MIYHGKATTPESFVTSQLVRDFLVFKALMSTTVDLPPALAADHDAAFAKVCEGIRTGAIVLDYAPEASGCVDMPPVSDPTYIQALLYWCAQMRCPMPRMAEAHARVGQFASRALLEEVLDVIEDEEAMPSTAFQTTNTWHIAGPRTIPLPLPQIEDKPASAPAPLLQWRL